jgi:hypothetical protein
LALDGAGFGRAIFTRFFDQGVHLVELYRGEDPASLRERISRPPGLNDLYP